MTDRRTQAAREHLRRMFFADESDTDPADEPDPILDGDGQDPPPQGAAGLSKGSNAATAKGWGERKRLKDRTPLTIAACVRCGRLLERQGKRPLFDAEGVPWYRCPGECEPPEGADWPATAVVISEILDSVFERDLLDPDDYLGRDDPEPEPPADDDDEQAAGSRSLEDLMARRRRAPLKDSMVHDRRRR